MADEFFIEAAKELASYVSEELLTQGRIYPDIANLRQISANVARRTADCAYSLGLARKQPRPPDLQKYIEAMMYVPSYENMVKGTAKN